MNKKKVALVVVVIAALVAVAVYLGHLSGVHVVPQAKLADISNRSLSLPNLLPAVSKVAVVSSVITSVPKIQMTVPPVTTTINTASPSRSVAVASIKPVSSSVAAMPTSTVTIKASSSSVVTAAPVSPKKVSSTIATTSTLILPYSVGTFGNHFIEGDGWVDWQGALSQKNGILTLGASATTTSGEAFLNGSNGWADYSVQANVDWVKGQSFGIIARYADTKNYLLCDFSEPSVGTVHMSIKEYSNGKVTDQATNDIVNYEQMGGAGITVYFGIRDSEGVCSFNNKWVSAFSLAATSSSTQKGGIAFVTWDPKKNNSELIVHTIGVVSGTYGPGF